MFWTLYMMLVVVAIVAVFGLIHMTRADMFKRALVRRERDLARTAVRNATLEAAIRAHQKRVGRNFTGPTFMELWALVDGSDA